MIDDNYILSDLCSVTNDLYPFLYLAVQHLEVENKRVTQEIAPHDFVSVFGSEPL